MADLSRREILRLATAAGIVPWADSATVAAQPLHHIPCTLYCAGRRVRVGSTWYGPLGKFEGINLSHEDFDGALKFELPFEPKAFVTYPTKDAHGNELKRVVIVAARAELRYMVEIDGKPHGFGPVTFDRTFVRPCFTSDEEVCQKPLENRKISGWENREESIPAECCVECEGVVSCGPPPHCVECGNTVKCCP